MADYTIKINPQGVVAELHRSIQRARDLVAFGLNVARDASKGTQDSSQALPMPISGVVMQFVLAPTNTMDFDLAREEYQSWILGCALRDCTEALAVTLEETRKIGVLASFGKSITHDDLKKSIVEDATRFDRMPLPDKVKRLCQICGPDVMPQLMDKVITIHIARNCLAHRGGIVAQRDLNSTSPEGLLVEWVKVEMIAGTSQGEHVITVLPIILKDCTVSMRWSAVNRVFHRGERVRFSVLEFNDICWTLFLFGQQLVKNLQDLLASNGLVDSDARSDSRQPSQ